MFIDAMGEGVLITGRDGGIVYANRAYADLIGATEASQARALERVMVGNPEAAEAIYRIAQELREGRAGDGGGAHGGAACRRRGERAAPAGTASRRGRCRRPASAGR